MLQNPQVSQTSNKDRIGKVIKHLKNLPVRLLIQVTILKDPDWMNWIQKNWPQSGEYLRKNPQGSWSSNQTILKKPKQNPDWVWECQRIQKRILIEFENPKGSWKSWSRIQRLSLRMLTSPKESPIMCEKWLQRTIAIVPTLPNFQLCPNAATKFSTSPIRLNRSINNYRVVFILEWL